MTNPIRSFAEKLTRPIRFRRRLPSDFGHAPIWVSPSSGLRFLLRPIAAIDPVLLRLTEALVKPGQIAWDVGANQGLFAVAAANRAGPEGGVVAFEPDCWLVGLLRRSARSQPTTSARIDVLPVALANSLDIRSFSIAVRSRATNFLTGYGSTQTGGTAEVQSVMSVTLDWLSTRLPAPDVVKIDVEGAELEVLEGAAGLLRDKRPAIICEVSAASADSVTDILLAYGYTLFDGEDPRGFSKPVQQAAWCTVALPQPRESPSASHAQ